MVKISNDIFIGVNLNEVYLAWYVNYNGQLNVNNVTNGDNYGLRPDFLHNRDLRNQGT